MKKLLYILLLLSCLLPTSTFSDDENRSDSWGSHENDYNSDHYYFSVYPSDTQSVEQGYYIVSGYQNVSVYEPVYHHIPSPPPVTQRRHPKKPEPQPKPKSPEPKPTPKPKPPEQKKPERKTEPSKKKHQKEKEHILTQAEKEKRAEDEYYNSHTHRFPKNAVFDEYL